MEAKMKQSSTIGTRWQRKGTDESPATPERVAGVLVPRPRRPSVITCLVSEYYTSSDFSGD